MANGLNTYISFKINNVDFCVDVKYVVGILEESTSTPVSNAHECVEGMVQYLEKIVTQVDLHKFLLNCSRDRSIRHSLIVCGDDTYSLAFKVDSINGIYDVDSSDLTTLDSVLSNSKKTVSNVFNHKGVINQVLNVRSIYNTILGVD